MSENVTVENKIIASKSKKDIDELLHCAEVCGHKVNYTYILENIGMDVEMGVLPNLVSKVDRVPDGLLARRLQYFLSKKQTVSDLDYIAAKTDFPSSSSSRDSMLLPFISLNDIKVVKRLHDAGARNREAKKLAALAGNLDIFNIFLESGPYDLQMQLCAVRGGSSEIVKFVLKDATIRGSEACLKLAKRIHVKNSQVYLQCRIAVTTAHNLYTANSVAAQHVPAADSLNQ